MSIPISNEKYAKGFESPKLYSHWSEGKEDELELALRRGWGWWGALMVTGSRGCTESDSCVVSPPGQMWKEKLN